MASKSKGTGQTMNSNVSADQKTKPRGLDRQIQAKIGQQLRAMYDDVVDQGVPDRFTELLAKLDKSGKRDDQEPSA